MDSSVHVLKFGILFAFLLFKIETAAAENPTIPQYDSNLHLGVATCAGSTCHGASEAFESSTVLQNEYLTWQREDKHAKAYKVLLNDDSKRIARNLGLKSAQTAKICLDCHSDNVPKENRGKRFYLSDGVGCEACHGGAEKYLGLHVSGIATHEENISNGLFPTENPLERAKLCLSCHLGTKDKFVTHRIMGAGHPRLSFELDTYTATAPAHFTIDADYKERKIVWSNARTWAIGQAITVQNYLDLISSPQHLRDGLFPELSFFECYACHQSMHDKRWQKRSSNGLGPGKIRLQESNLLMLRHIANAIDPELAGTIKNKTLRLHQASTQSIQQIISAAKDLKTINSQLINKIAATNFDSRLIKKVLNSIITYGIKGNYFDYASAEQSLMAIEALATTLANAGAINFSTTSPLSISINKLYNQLEKDNQYAPGDFSLELENIKANIL